MTLGIIIGIIAWLFVLDEIASRIIAKFMWKKKKKSRRQNISFKSKKTFYEEKWDQALETIKNSLDPIKQFSKSWQKQTTLGKFKSRVFPSRQKKISFSAQILKLLWLLLLWVIAIPGALVGWVLRLLYKFLAFLWQPGHYIIRYGPYLLVVNLYERLFGGERYILIFITISQAIWYWIMHFFEEDSPDFQKQMNKLNFIYLSVMVWTFLLFVILRWLYERTWFGLPDRHSDMIQAVFDRFTKIEIDILEVVFPRFFS